ncbi:hypothetical protein K7X08_032280 [Anisodus acutangulus]|uniref:Uncharacterized protein n=1 Tax=Anisodus acutangulus TaxID=402998 RepID=A0A9Q1MC71_9SOLA|nr:hypothetical protein K7X08_032280 [Anisodus acutangulus]
MEKCRRLHGFPPNFKFTKVFPSKKVATHVELEGSGYHDNFHADSDVHNSAGVNHGHDVTRSQSCHSSTTPANSMFDHASGLSSQYGIPGLSPKETSQLMHLL